MILLHNQVLVIYPKENVELDDVMYWYQEVDKTQKGKMCDDRCQFFLEIPEKEIPSVLSQIKERLTNKVEEFLEEIQFRSKHSTKEFKEKYGYSFQEFIPSLYVSYINDLKLYDEIKDLPFDDPRQINFIKKHGYFTIDKWTDVYIKGEGYGAFHNPYQMWDYYLVVNEDRFPSDVQFLVNRDGDKSNKMFLGELDIPSTVKNINDYTRVWEYVIFCEKEASKSKVYTVDDIRFDKEWNKDCLVDSLEDVLVRISEGYPGSEYVVVALDFHW